MRYNLGRDNNSLNRSGGKRLSHQFRSGAGGANRRRPVNSSVMSLSPIMKQPRITAQITFLPASEGGRESLPNDFSGGQYRPHVVVGDPNQRKAVLVNSVAQEKYLGVAFVGGPLEVVAGEPFLAEFALMYWPNVSYDSLVPDATFTLREGPHIIGFGTVQTSVTNSAT